ncbi:YidC/Oxa1 family membrane protein insertase [Chloroflexota bacterium]
MGDIWNVVLLNPMINGLIIFSNVFFGNFGIAILVLTVVVRLLMLPLTLRQLRSMKAMQSLQPRMQELQKKYAKDKQKLSAETMKLYKESGVNPMGCLSSMLIQFPIWIALYQSVVRALATTPEAMLNLSERLYSVDFIQHMVPLESRFLWLDLAKPDSILILPILVAATMYVQQKMTVMPSIDQRQASTQRMMTWMFPLMFGFITMQLPSGLGLYFVATAIISIAMQYRMTGWGSLVTKAPAPSGKTAKSPAAADDGPIVKGIIDGNAGAEQGEDAGLDADITTDMLTKKTYRRKPKGKRKGRKRGHS